jgi:predicted metalloprotease with PDZ domain
LPELHGALVNKVLPGSPAANSGVRKNDIIIEVNGIAISSTHDADVHLDSCTPGQSANIKVARGEAGKLVQLQAVPQDVLTMIMERKAGRGRGSPPAAYARPAPYRQGGNGKPNTSPHEHANTMTPKQFA